MQVSAFRFTRVQGTAPERWSRQGHGATQAPASRRSGPVLHTILSRKLYPPGATML